MNITEDLKSTLNKTLEIALGIEKVNSMINPQKAHTDGKNLVNAIYKDVQILSNQSRGRNRLAIKHNIRAATKTSISRSERKRDPTNIEFQKQFSLSIKNVNQRVKMSRAGKRTVRQSLDDEFLPFNKSFDKTLSSRSHTPKPKSLPYVSLTTGKLENPVTLPNFSEYLETKGSNYLKMKFNDELICRFNKATTRVTKFNEEFDAKASTFIKSLEDRNRRGTMFKKPSNQNFNDGPSIKKRSVVIKGLIFDLNSNIKKKNHKDNFSNTKNLSIQGFNTAKKNENQKLLDIINKMDLERPSILRQKVNLIQNDHEKYKNNLHSLKKFEKFRLTVESNRRKRQNVNSKQGAAYMNIIENFRSERHKPSLGELEILEFWKEMVECGWVITAADLQEVQTIVAKKGFSSDLTKSLLQKFSQAISI